MEKIDRAKSRVQKLMIKHTFIQGMAVQQSADGDPEIVLRVDQDTSLSQRNLLPKQIEDIPVFIGETIVSRYGPSSPAEEHWAKRFTDRSEDSPKKTR